jgi:hypothetical protein
MVCIQTLSMYYILYYFTRKYRGMLKFFRKIQFFEIFYLIYSANQKVVALIKSNAKLNLSKIRFYRNLLEH